MIEKLRLTGRSMKRRRRSSCQIQKNATRTVLLTLRV